MQLKIPDFVTNQQIEKARRYVPSLLQVAQSLPFILIILILLSACSITHRHGEMPKVEVDNPLADKTTVKLKDDEIIVKMEWDI